MKDNRRPRTPTIVRLLVGKGSTTVPPTLFTSSLPSEISVRPAAAAAATVGTALVTVRSVAVTAVTTDRPLLAAVVKPLAVISSPTAKPFVMNDPVVRE